jgi:hypothetical protein
MKKPLIFIVIFTASLLLFNSYSWSQKSSEWELVVNAEKAEVHLLPNTESTVVITLPKGYLLKSYEKTEDWFRIIIGPDEDGIVTIGYIKSQNVDVIRENVVEELDYWEEDPEFFEGIGLTVRLTGGPSFIGGGDLRKGDRGLYDAASDLAAASGFLLDRYFDEFNSGFEVTADFVYSITPKIGLGLGFGYMNLSEHNLLVFHSPGGFENNQVGTSPKIRAYPVRLGVFYNIPISRLFNLTLNSGAAFYFAKYSYIRSSNWYPIDLINQKANTTGIGFHGGISVEINFHPRAALILEGRGRYCKISGFTGESHIKKSILPPLLIEDIEEKGTLYYVEGDGFPLLAFSEQKPTDYKTVREATVDLSGFVFQAGLKVKF